MTPAHYRRVRRWHLLIGLVIAPVLVALTITGALYLFDREFEGWWFRGYHDAHAHATAARPLAEQEAAVREATGNSILVSVALPRAPGDPAEWSVTDAGGTPWTVFVDPARARVLGWVRDDARPMQVVRNIHSGLLIGTPGRYIVECAASWVLIMIVTGLWQWWPRQWPKQWSRQWSGQLPGRGHFRGVLTPRFDAGWKIGLRDLHAVTAACLSIVLAGFVLSGLPWSVFWGAQFVRLGAVAPFVAPSPGFGGPPQDLKPTSFDTKLPWPVQHAQMLGMIMPGDPVAGTATLPQAGIAVAEALLPGLPTGRYGPGVRIRYPAPGSNLYVVAYTPDAAEGQHTLYVDGSSGKLLRDVAWRDYSLAGKLTEWGVATHTGREYGPLNQWFNLLVCLALLTAVSAAVARGIWRRRHGNAVVPDVSRQDRMPGWLWGVIIAIAVFSPLVLVTGILAWGAETWLQRRATKGQ